MIPPFLFADVSRQSPPPAFDVALHCLAEQQEIEREDQGVLARGRRGGGWQRRAARQGFLGHGSRK